MASFHNFTNEKSSFFEDTTYDPDLEARLYAEIYYSNETYEVDDCASSLKNSPNLAPNLPIEASASSSDADCAQPIKENSAVDLNPNEAGESVDESADPRSFYPSRSWVSGKASKDAGSNFAKQSPRSLTQQRLLARKNLWQQIVDSESRRRFIEAATKNREDLASQSRLAESASFTRVVARSIEAASFTPVVNRSNEAANISRGFASGLTNFSETAELTDDIIRSDCSRMLQDSLVAKKRAKKEQRRNARRLRRQQYRAEKQALRLSQAVKSKYRVVSKKKKLKMKEIETEPVDISSDSDDSILEVPVPPKTPPLIIQLHDSDDDCEQSNKSQSKKRRNPPEEPPEESMTSDDHETDSSKDDESFVPPTCEASPTSLQRVGREAAKKTKNPEIPDEVSSIQPQEFDDNCGKSGKSRSKKCKKSAEEPREESMPRYSLETDSSKDCESSAAPTREASTTNLDKILKEAAKKAKIAETSVAVPSLEDINLILNCTEVQKGASSLEEIRRMRETVTLSHAHSDDSMTESEASNWVNIAAGQATSSRENEEICSIEIAASSSEVTSPIQMASKTTEGDVNVSVINSEVANPRKRRKDAVSSPFKDFEVPAVPEKRIRQNRHKSSREQSMTEYFFKPMSKELQTFYNNPWGGENLDTYDIQSRMPKNPNCWTILDADLQGPSSKRRKLCPRCKTDSHFGRRCPEKAKPPCCYMCGDQGHTESRCPHTMCLTCGRKYATYRPTCGHCSELYCTICNGRGHNCESCPDLWRRYHNTTTETMPIVPRDTANVMKPTQHLTCCNCAKRGHDVTMCRQLRWSQHFTTPMLISSYTKGPMYEPSNRHPIRDTSRDNVFTSELPQNEQVRDADASSRPIHETYNERLHESIEIIEIPVEPPLEPSIPVPEGRIVFQAGEIDQQRTIGWQESTKRLDTIKNIELTGLLAGHSKPTFLITWQAHFEFCVQITHDIASGVLVTIKCKTHSLFRHFEKVIWQWLFRSDAEKAYLAYDELPYDNVPLLARKIKEQLARLKTVLEPVKLLRKIAMSDQVLRQTHANLKPTRTRKYRRKLSAAKHMSAICMSRRCQLVTSLYSGSWVERENTFVQMFCSLASYRIPKTGKKVPPNAYMQLVYLYNKLFTFHETAALTKALEKAVAASQQSASADPQLAQLSSDMLKYPSADVIAGDLCSIGKSGLRKVRKVPEKSNSVASAMNEEQPNAHEDPLAESLQILANTNSARVSDATPQSSDEPLILDGCDDAPALNQKEQIRKSKNRKKKGKTGLLANLTKNNRRLYRRSAQSIMQIANSSNVPRLREMAKVLKKKIKDCTAETDDIDSLQCAITADLRCKNLIGVNSYANNGSLMPFKGTRSHRQPDERQVYDQSNVLDQAYVKFLRTL